MVLLRATLRLPRGPRSLVPQRKEERDLPGGMTPEVSTALSSAAQPKGLRL